ncbi:NmrA family NAD(P)-binding protein [Brachybacterium saurashtrense]|uniref:Hydroxylase n=1 Tax=Brachybacterium saurashtrense TaxID=556288 RepID=A0A345YLP7_9MICO|nr:NmrA family NAD(P)-binding protein [Brachybacterium saurashtrense]AXK44849.1 hydroxylase [Brachybacterium saurashtrense]RRR20742.1 hydroxylase [Brachybacterium saurashtrense]
MAYIIHGATGAQGSPVLSALTAAGHAAVAAVRDVSKVDGEAIAIDNSSADSLAAAYEGAEGMFVHLPLGRPQDQVAYAQAIGQAIRRTKPPRVVFSTSGYTADMSGHGQNAPDVLIRELAESGVSYAVVEPRLYLENLLLPVTLEPVRSEGALRYPIRADYVTSWSSHLDVADVVVRLLTDHTVTGVVSIGALPGLVGEDLAAGFSRYLGETVRFESITPAQYGELITPLFGEGAAAPVVASYEHRRKQPGEVIPEERSAQTLLGLAPRSVEQWLRDLGI